MLYFRIKLLLSRILNHCLELKLVLSFTITFSETLVFTLCLYDYQIYLNSASGLPRFFIYLSEIVPHPTSSAVPEFVSETHYAY